MSIRNVHLTLFQNGIFDFVCICVCILLNLNALYFELHDKNVAIAIVHFHAAKSWEEIDDKKNKISSQYVQDSSTFD